MTGSAAPKPPQPRERRFAGDSAGELELEALEHEKDLLRREAGARRERRTAPERLAAAAGITQQVTSLIDGLGLSEGDVAAAYVSRDDEPGTTAALEVMRQAGIDVLLPVLGPSLDRQWGIYTGQRDLAQRAPGRPLEPTVCAGGAEVLVRAALVLVPALAIDGAGVRLGRGGGWYDRVLLHADPEATVAGVVFEDECNHPPLPRAGHDIRVGAVLTPARWWHL